MDLSPGLTITVIDPDEDYLGIEIQVCSNRYAGSARIYASLDELADVAAALAGFPADRTDSRAHTFGSQDPKVAGGYCRLSFRCSDGAGHVCVQVAIQDDPVWHLPASASLTFYTEPAAIDEFVQSLRRAHASCAGAAVLRGMKGPSPRD